MKRPAIYIMANKRNGTLYTGVTSDLVGRVHRHKNGIEEGFTLRYGCKMLVYYEAHEDMAAQSPARSRSRQVHAERSWR